jgi:pyruvate dehydrogenase complex dehydrogenase (E1) component
MLAENHGVAADVWSATSYKQLRDDALAVEPPASNHGIDPDLVDPRDR